MKEKIYYIVEFLDKFKATVFRQVMFAEFEHLIHKKYEAGESLTKDLLCKTYYDLNRKHFSGAVTIDKDIQYEWARIPHFYTPFYVYKYATGISAACKIVDGILNNEKDALDNYLNMLKSGSRQNPLDTLKIAGVDMTDKEVYESAIKMFDETIEEFKTLIEK